MKKSYGFLCFINGICNKNGIDNRNCCKNSQYSCYHRKNFWGKYLCWKEIFHSYSRFSLLGALCCGIGVFFVSPYYEASMAELYAASRAYVLQNNTRSPICALWLSIITFPSKINWSACLLEQMPTSLKYLLIRIPNEGMLSDQILRGSHYHEKEYVVTLNKDITPFLYKQ